MARKILPPDSNGNNCGHCDVRGIKDCFGIGKKAISQCDNSGFRTEFI